MDNEIQKFHLVKTEHSQSPETQTLPILIVQWMEKNIIRTVLCVIPYLSEVVCCVYLLVIQSVYPPPYNLFIQELLQ